MKPSNICSIVGIIDQKLVVTNGDLEILPVELNSPLLSFYFQLKAGNPKFAFESAKALSIQDQVPLIKTCLVVSTDRVLPKLQALSLVLGFPELLVERVSSGVV